MRFFVWDVRSLDFSLWVNGSGIVKLIKNMGRSKGDVKVFSWDEIFGWGGYLWRWVWKMRSKFGGRIIKFVLDKFKVYMGYECGYVW